MIRAALFIALCPAAAAAKTALLHAVGSLEAALSEAAADFAKAEGVEVKTAFGPSGLLRERIEGGEAAHVFASADMEHPGRLAASGKAGPAALFTRNRLCALTAREDMTTSEGLLAPEV